MLPSPACCAKSSKAIVCTRSGQRELLEPTQSASTSPPYLVDKRGALIVDECLSKLGKPRSFGRLSLERDPGCVLLFVLVPFRELVRPRVRQDHLAGLSEGSGLLAAEREVPHEGQQRSRFLDEGAAARPRWH